MKAQRTMKSCSMNRRSETPSFSAIMFDAQRGDPNLNSKRLFRGLTLITLALLVPLLSLPLVFASTYVGYGSSNQGSSTCGTNCEGDSGSGVLALGETIQSPFTGTLTSVGIFTGNTVPNQVVVLTFPVGSNPTFTNYSCGSAGTCSVIANGQTFTVQDVESITGLSTSAFFTINLASPVSVTLNQWVAIVYMITGGSAASYIMLVGSGGQTGATLDTGFTFGSTNPATGSTASSQGPGVASAGIVGGSFTAQGTSGGTLTVTQCYGNCGTPPITLVNTNSTHSVNFNQSIQLFYQFQSNLNGFLLNVTTNAAKSYVNTANGPIFTVYLVQSCPLGQQPFTQQCPGVSQSSGGFLSVPKGRSSLANLKVAVSNGQWVGIALSAPFSGFDVNDTNTIVPMFQTNQNGVITSASSFSTTSKVGLWAWIVGNVVSGSGPTSPTGPCTNLGFLDCFFTNLVNSFCSNVTTACQTSSAILWTIIFTIITMMLLAYGESRIAPSNKGLTLVTPELGLTFFIGFLLMMAGIGLVTAFAITFFIMIFTLLFAKHTGKFF